MPEVILNLTHDSLMELLHGLTDNDLQYLATAADMQFYGIEGGFGKGEN